MKILSDRSKSLLPRIDVIYLLVRVLVLLGFVWYVVSSDRPEIDVAHLYLILGTYIANLFIFYYAIVGKFDIKLAYLAAISYDLILIPAMIAASGGADSAFFLMYFMTISVAAYVLTFRIATVVTLISTVSYLVIMSPDVVARNLLDLTMCIGFFWVYLLAISYASTYLRRSERRFLKLFEALNLRTTELEKIQFKLQTVYENSCELAAILDAETVVRYVMRIMGEVLRCDSYGIIIRDKSEELFLRSQYSEGKACYELRPFPQSRQELVRMTIEQGEPALLKKLESRTDYCALSNQSRSLMLVPLSSHGVTTGLLVAESNQESGFDDKDVQMLSIVSRSATSALENAESHHLLITLAEESKRPNQSLPRIDPTYEKENKWRYVYATSKTELGQAISQAADIKTLVRDHVNYSKFQGKIFNILVGDSPDNCLEKFFSESNSEYSIGELAVKLDFSYKIDELYHIAASKKYDVAFLLLNNIISMLEERLPLVSFLSSMGIPVIALYGSPSDDSYVNKVIEAGAIFSASFPCEYRIVEQALIKSLCNSECSR